MLRERCQKFLNDEMGGGTIFGLMWFVLLVGITGMAVDVTNGFRNRTMLQATADAAALAAVIDLPDETTAVATAIAYSDGNMPSAMYGNVLKAADVEVGAWGTASQSFEAGGVVPDPLDPTGGTLFPDSVRVTLRQTEANTNAVPVNFLRIIGLQTWDVNVEAVAQRYLPDCLNDGLVARGVVDISSNNAFINRICIHGQLGVMLQNHNYEELGVIVSMPDIDTQLILPTGGLEGNPGLAEALREQSLDPRMVNHVNEIMLDILALQPYVLPDYVSTGTTDGGDGGCTWGVGCTGSTGGTTTTTTNSVIDAYLYFEGKGKNGVWTYSFSTLEAGRVYHLICPDGEKATVPDGTVMNQVVVVSDCPIKFGSDIVLSDVIIASLDGGNDGDGGGPSTGGGGNGKKSGTVSSGAGGPGVENANITFAANGQIGAADNCAPGGGVQFFTNASISFAANTTYNGVQIVAAGDVDLTALAMGINGINVQAGRDITLTSNNAFGLCSGGAPNLQTVPYYRLVH